MLGIRLEAETKARLERLARKNRVRQHIGLIESRARASPRKFIDKSQTSQRLALAMLLSKSMPRFSQAILDQLLDSARIRLRSLRWNPEVLRRETCLIESLQELAGSGKLPLPNLLDHAQCQRRIEAPKPPEKLKRSRPRLVLPSSILLSRRPAPL